jgi:hypothetical protein
LRCARHDIESGRHEHLELLVKGAGLPEVTRQSLFAELFGCVLAREVGLLTPRPVLVEVSSDFAALVNDTKLLPKTVALQAGLAVGFEYYNQALLPATGISSLTDEQYREAASIYCFDLATQNPDRIVSNPNCFVLRGHLIPIDFGMCFSFLYALRLVETAPWQVSHLRFATNHLFAKHLREKRQLDWDAEVFAHIQPVFERERLLELLEGAVPSEWRERDDEVVDHLAQIGEHLDEFKWELLRSVA